METRNIKNYQFAIGLSLVFIGILIFSFLTDPVRYFGFIFIIGAAVYFINSNTPKAINRNSTRKFRSRTRDQILRHQHRANR
jgi:hypothetical protein